VGELESSTPGGLVGFCHRLRRLQRTSGITQRDLAHAVEISEQQMSDILNGRIRRLPPWPRVRTMVEACRDHAAADASTLPPDLADPETWRSRYFDLEQDLDAPVSDSGTTRPLIGRLQPKAQISSPETDDKSGMADLAMSSHVQSLPPRNPFFTGRARLLEDIHRRLMSESQARAVSILPLQGMGGIGKTQLALEYAHAHARDFDIVWWINAVNFTSSVTDLVALAERLGIPTDKQPVRTLGKLMDKLANMREWLLIYDNVEDSGTLREIHPPNTGGLIVTSRSPWVGRLGSMIEVAEFDRKESVALLKRRCPPLNERQADNLAEELGDLPIALEQAGCFLSETMVDVDSYLAVLAAQPEDAGLSDPTIDRHPGLKAVVDLSYLQLHARNPRCASFLTHVAFLAPDPLPIRDSQNHPKHAISIGDTVAEMAIMVRDMTALGLLRSSGTSLHIHRLVQALLRSRLDTTERNAALLSAQHLVTSADLDDPDDPASWPAYAAMTPHVQRLAQHASLPSNSSVEFLPQFRDLICKVGRYLYVLAQYKEGHELCEMTYVKWRDSLGADHTDVLRLVSILANFLSGLGENSKARDLNAETLSRYRTVLGPDNPSTLRAGNNLVVDLYGLGEYAAARDLAQDTFERRRRVLGADHRDTLLSANNLAGVLDKLGEYVATQGLHQDTLSRYRRVLGPDHPDTLRSANNLGDALSGLGAFEAARDLHEDTLARRRRVLGPDHPDTLRSANNLGDALSGLGAFEAARDLHEDTLARRRRVLGPDHADTLGTARSLEADLHGLRETPG
jgi:transcriptional regulator with XRE-family HTH domain